MFQEGIVDGAHFIDVTGVEDPEIERLRIVVEDGRQYLFQLVDHGEKGKFFVLDLKHSDEEGFTHACAAYRHVRPNRPDLAVFFRVWNPERSHETRQPKKGEWLAPLVGYVSPARKWSSEGIRHSMLGGQITEITSVVLERQP